LVATRQTCLACNKNPNQHITGANLSTGGTAIPPFLANIFTGKRVFNS